MEVIPLKRASLVVGYNQGGAVMIPHYANANKKIALLGVPGRYLLIQTRSVIDGGVVTLELNLDRYYGIEFEPLVEDAPTPPAVSEVPVE